MSDSRDELLAQIAEQETRLAQLDQQRNESLERLATLRQQWNGIQAVSAIAAHLPLF